MKEFYASMDRIDKFVLKKLHIDNPIHLTDKIVGFAPYVGALFMMIHTVGVIHGYQWTIAHAISKSALLAFIVITIMSIAFGFCWIHRAFCLYNLALNICVDYDFIIGFNDNQITAWTALAVGLCLFATFFRWLYLFGKCRLL